MSRPRSMAKRPHIVISADQLSAACVEEVVGACRGWATCERISQNTGKMELEKTLARTDIVVGWTDPLMLKNSPVSIYLCGSAGYDAYQGIGLDAKPGFRMTNAGAIMAIPIAEHCLALQFALVRELPEILSQQNGTVFQRRWDAGEVFGSTACIVGLGHTGTELARRCRALGQRVIGVSRTPRLGEEVLHEFFALDRLKEAVKEADHVFCLLAGGDSTRHVFRREIFAAMKPTACFYNASRGSLVQEEELVEALRTGRPAKAALDVFAVEPLPATSPLWKLPGVLISPHSAGLSSRLNQRLTQGFIENLNRLKEGKSLRNEVPLERLV